MTVNKIALKKQKETLLEQIRNIEYELVKDFIDAREAKGLKPNRLNELILARVIRHYFDNGCGMVSKSFKAIYDQNTDPDKRDKGMEVDWVEKMANRSYALDILVNTLNLLHSYEPLAPLFKAKTFKPNALLHVSSITAGIKYMDTIVAQELEIMRLQDLVSKYEAERVEILKEKVKEDWKSVALSMLSQGSTHKEVAEFVGKSTKTIQRLINK